MSGGFRSRSKSGDKSPEGKPQDSHKSTGAKGRDDRPQRQQRGGRGGQHRGRQSAKGQRPGKRQEGGLIQAALAAGVDAPRAVAFDVVRRVSDDDAFANLILPKALRKQKLKGRDAAFATELAYGTLRMRGLYDAVVEMDADGSHRPEHLPRMLAEAADADLVIGSRYVPGGKIVNWPLDRKAISMAGNLYIKLILGMPVNDATAGYRVYRAETLRTIGLDEVESAGYVFQTDLTVRTVRAGLRVVEVPITFVEREIGDSKMDGDVVRESMTRITRWGLAHRCQQLRRLVDREPTWHRL